jgi:hypothetical protein
MEISSPAVEWADETVLKTADEALEPTGPGGNGPSKACAFLKKYLSNGSMPQKQIEVAADEQGLSLDQLKRAKKKLNIETRKEGFGKGGVWVWALPGDKRGTQDDLPI